MFQKVDYDLVVYDEIELFRSHSDPMFNYPYQDRKSVLTKKTFDPEKIEFEADENLMEYTNYMYDHIMVNF